MRAAKNEALFKEDAEQLARQIQDDDPMIEIRDIQVDPAVGGYVIVAYDRRSDEQFVVDHYEAWAEKRREIKQTHLAEIVVEKVHERKGRKTAHLRGEWVTVKPENWPEDICGAIESKEVAGEPLIEIEPSLNDIEVLEPGHADPKDYSFDGTYLVLSTPETAQVWKLIERLANFTLSDQSDLLAEWKSLGFEIAPEPRAPLVEPGGGEWQESDVLQEVRDRLLDIADQGFTTILVDGEPNVTAYAWVLAGVMGLKVITAWTLRISTPGSGSATLGFSELLGYKEVEESF